MQAAYPPPQTLACIVLTKCDIQWAVPLVRADKKRSARLHGANSSGVGIKEKILGVRRSGASVALVLGDRWQSIRQVLRDIGIAAAFWIVSGGLLFVLAWLLRVAEHRPSLDFILPHGGVEITVWIALSITAGICEETVFRGYLQRQFMALTRSVPAGILLAAVAFGAAHAYQGFRMVILIGLYGAMFRILAHWRGSVRPGMIAHAWQDSLGGVLSGLSRH
jgi:CAAX protease family protein